MTASCTSVGVYMAAMLGGAGAIHADEAGRESPLLLGGPYALNIKSNAAVICWQTRENVAGSARYAIAPDEPSAVGVGETGKFHAVTLKELKPDTAYRVKTFAGGRALGGLRFRTAPIASDACTFFVYGDTRTCVEDHARVARAMADQAQALPACAFIIHLGDYAMMGSDEEGWAREFFEPAACFLRTVPLVPVRGNHDAGELFARFFPAPERSPAARGADDYCYDYGPVRVLVLDQYAVLSPGDSRLGWVAERLAEAGNKWRVVCFHEPVYSTGAHASDAGFRQMIEPVLQKGKAHVVFTAHDHDYERTKPIGGVTYLVSGGGGGPLRGQREPQSWSARFESVHHFLVVNVAREKMTITACRPGGTSERFEAFDSAVIPWQCDWPAARE